MSHPKKKIFFISYSWRDKKSVLKAAKEIKRVGCSYWMDDKEIVGGDSIYSEIAEQISNNADHFIAFLPTKRDLSASIKNEYQVAQERASRDEAFRIIPVLLKNKRPIPSEFRGKLIIKLYNIMPSNLHHFGNIIRNILRKSISRQIIISDDKPLNDRNCSIHNIDNFDLSLDKIIKEITEGQSLSDWADKIAQALNVWGVLILRIDENKEWECIAGKGFPRQCFGKITDLPKYCRPPQKIPLKLITHTRIEVPFRRGKSYSVKFHSQLWKFIASKSQKGKSRIVGAVAVFSDAQKGERRLGVAERNIIEKLEACLEIRLANFNTRNKAKS